MILNRFTIPSWVSSHMFEYDDWRKIPESRIKAIKSGLLKFETDNPQVSIVIPVWNEEKNIVRTLSSFASMNVPVPTELIFVNNNSSDNTQQILDYLGATSITETKQGIAHARLAGLVHARGTYHLCGDGDSLYPPNWINSMVAPLENPNISCVYANYSFIPVRNTSRILLGLYELLAETLFEMRRLKREFLNVRGANFGFRRDQGIQVKGFDMPVTRVFANNETDKTFVVFGEDGRMGRKLGELGKLKLIHSSKARIWTSARRLLKDGSLHAAFIKRIRKESTRIFEYLVGSRVVSNTTDNLPLHS